MLKRLIALTGVLAALAGTAAVAPTPAFASVSCSTHNAGTAPDPGYFQSIYGGDFQCSPDFQVEYFLMYYVGANPPANSSYVVAQCGSVTCHHTFPEGTTNCGSYWCSGTLHSPSGLMYSTTPTTSDCGVPGGNVYEKWKVVVTDTAGTKATYWTAYGVC